ncbi:MAG: tetratricopeptide repeat protein [Candidatus Heimdallarchaeota archaeon]|nr:tetratricopeptide repeat protein [Candidatus Heimdallarchaeota archaeon]
MREIVCTYLDKGEFKLAHDIIRTIDDDLERQYLSALYYYTSGYYTRGVEELPDMPSGSANYVDGQILKSKFLWRQDRLNEALDCLKSIDSGLKGEELAKVVSSRVTILLNLGRTDYRFDNAIFTDDFNNLLDLCEKQRKFCKKQKLERLEYDLNNVLAFLYALTGDHEKGLTMLQSNLWYARKNKLRTLEGFTHELIATFQLMEYTDSQEAAYHVGLSLEIRETIDDLPGIARSQIILSHIAYEHSRLIDSYGHLARAKHIYKKLSNPLEMTWVAFIIGYRMFYPEAKLKQSEKSLRDALLSFKALNCEQGTAITLTRLGSIELAKGNLDEALSMHTEAEHIVTNWEYNSPIHAIIAYHQGTIHKLYGQLDKARGLFEFALQQMNKLGHRYYSAHVLNELGDICRIYGEYKNALQYYTSALKATEDLDRCLTVDFIDATSCYSALIMTSETNIEDQQPYINRLEILEGSEYADSFWIRESLIIARAIYLMQQPRLKQHYKAQEMLEHLVDNQSFTNINSSYAAEMLLIQLLLDEYKISGYNPIIEEVKTRLLNLKSTATSNNLAPMQIDVGVLFAKMMQIEGNFEDSETMLRELLHTAESLNLLNRSDIILQEIDSLENDIQQFKIYTKDLDLRERLETMKIQNYLDMAKKHLAGLKK